MLTLALDAMGGDFGPTVVLEGAQRALEWAGDSSLNFLIFGDKEKITPFIERYPALQKASTIFHVDLSVSNEMKPALAVRIARRSSMGLAIEAVAKGDAQGVVSAGNTGAYMALSKILLKMVAGIERPAIPASIPNLLGKSLVLDLGANIDCTPKNLVEFACMGSALAHHLFNKENPSIGLLNVGSESLKGNAIVQEAATLLKGFPHINFYGFVEGNDILSGKTDVIVTDGFTGNVALKSIEGTVKLLRSFLKEELSRSWKGKLGYKIAQGTFNKLHKKTDPRTYNGAPFLGLKKIAVKSHGGTDALGFFHAIKVAFNLASKDFIGLVEQHLNTVLDNKEKA